jgi:hypothetical protein
MEQMYLGTHPAIAGCLHLAQGVRICLRAKKEGI